MGRTLRITGVSSLLVALLLCLVVNAPVARAGVIDPASIVRSPIRFSRLQLNSVANASVPTVAVQGMNATSQGAPTAARVAGDPSVNTVPYFKSSFSYNGTVYPYRMVGTDPARGSNVTVVPALLFPLKLVFADGSVFDSSPLVPYVSNSPVFRPGSFDSGFTQYGDAVQRDSFWNYVSTRSRFYHTWLAGPIIFPTITLNVPADQGEVATVEASGKKVGIPSFDFMEQTVANLYAKYHISPRVLPIFLTGDVFPGDAFGYHNAVVSTDQKQIFTYVVTNWLSKGLTGHEADEDASTLTHEVSEWISDPFVLDNTNNTTGITYNVTPEWFTEGYGCQDALEVGDPVYIFAFRFVGYRDFTYHLQDIVFLSWFARQVPSTAHGGLYTYMNTFNSPSTDCPPGT